jgi:DNA processing protein
MTKNDDLKYWLALSLVKDVGPVTIKKLLSVFRSPRKILHAGLDELADIDDISESRLKKIYEFNEWDMVEREIKAINHYAVSHGIKVITYADSEYPENLRQIDDSPMLLYAKGNIIKEDKYAVAIVGSRDMSEYGKRATTAIASELALCGLTIVSGMAKGIDTVAHTEALKAGGRSIAVLGCGIDSPYPSENIKLFNSLSESGCVISEFPFGTPPNRENFPKRNRLISGLSFGIVVVEATRNSGSLITANCALDQGREVFAVPGNITSRNSEGTNSLLKKGAKLVQNAKDILEELSPQLKSFINFSKNKGEDIFSKNAGGLEITNEEKAICYVLGSEPKHIDLIIRETKMPSARLLGILLDLEIKGIIKQAGGQKFYLNY